MSMAQACVCFPVTCDTHAHSRCASSRIQWRTWAQCDPWGMQNVMTVASTVLPPYSQGSFSEVYGAITGGRSSGDVTIGKLAAIDKVGTVGNGVCEVGELQAPPSGKASADLPTWLPLHMTI